ncbi:M23 family peptidase [Mucilaginibacter terrenus]|uniref:M23 family peptidase n=1 Tax=Mucilaginibacter terrenus TaxID=2482727 RepID=A0A3E2NY11_9SPHI|nr:M23 family metallopeptidase [Mucilaginibacter terrenus]RFZ85872.1 M23 family peptidase [Mucilaginibacter terrenus]
MLENRTDKKNYIVNFLAAALLLFANYSSAQDIIQSKKYPQNYFRYPLDLPPTTAGSFGELRPAHFHSGLDFKTMQRTGYPVHAVADGYVSRLRIQFGGFGQAIYVTHPNGYTSVYGHIQSFTPATFKYIRDYQYKNQVFDADIKVPPGLFKVQKGDVIAISGNEGASAGPHVHFELRDSLTEETINPQLFGLTIPDKVPPTITALAVYHLNGNPFSENTPKEFMSVTGAAGNYRLATPKVLQLSGNTGFGIAVTDQNSASVNHNGVYSIEMKLDGSTVYTFTVERFAFDQTHAVNAYIDYPAFLLTRRMFQKCFILPGSRISLYPQSVNRGIIPFNDNEMHDVEFVCRDVMGNTSTIAVKVQSNTTANNNQPAKPTGTFFHYDERSVFANDKVRVQIDPGNLYDDLDFQYSTQPIKAGAYSVTHRIHNKFTPIHGGYDIWIKPDVSLGNYADKAVIVNGATGSINGKYDGGYVKAVARTFGDYYIRIDTVPPVITPLNIKNGSNMAKVKAIRLKMSDNLSGVKSFAGKIDGKWVLVEWSYKTRVLSYTFTEDIKPGKHNFEFTVIDGKDNTAKFTAEFTR